MNLANQLTVLRIILAVATFLALLRGEISAHWIALGLFSAALITDWVDGAVARITRTVSIFGKVADPIADKILVLGALLALLHSHRLEIPLWGVFLILARELLIGGLRVLASSSGKVMAAERWGKWKMGVQSAAVLLMIGILVLVESCPQTPQWASDALPYYLTVLCVVASWSSAYFYFKKSRKMLEKSWS